MWYIVQLYTGTGLHGWKDNAGSWEKTAPQISQEGYHVVALDFAGHGDSEHRREDTPYLAILYAVDMLHGLKSLNWLTDKLEMSPDIQLFILGHSLGGAMASILSGTLHKQLSGAVYLEALGILTGKEEHSPGKQNPHEDFLPIARFIVTKILILLDQERFVLQSYRRLCLHRRLPNHILPLKPHWK